MGSNPTLSATRSDAGLTPEARHAVGRLQHAAGGRRRDAGDRFQRRGEFVLRQLGEEAQQAVERLVGTRARTAKPRAISDDSARATTPTARSKSRTKPWKLLEPARSATTSRVIRRVPGDGIGSCHGRLDQRQDRVGLTLLALLGDALEPDPVVADLDVGDALGPRRPTRTGSGTRSMSPHSSHSASARLAARCDRPSASRTSRSVSGPGVSRGCSRAPEPPTVARPRRRPSHPRRRRSQADRLCRRRGAGPVRMVDGCGAVADIVDDVAAWSPGSGGPGSTFPRWPRSARPRVRPLTAP